MSLHLGLSAGVADSLSGLSLRHHHGNGLDGGLSGHVARAGGSLVRVVHGGAVGTLVVAGPVTVICGAWLVRLLAQGVSRGFPVRLSGQVPDTKNTTFN